MARQAKWALLLLCLPADIRAAEPITGFQDDRRVRRATRLDWRFAAGMAARLPAEHDSRRVRYQLFVPPTYQATADWPLVLFVAPGDAPLGWSAWKEPCEKAEVLFAVAWGAGNDRPEAQRLRILCDVLDDIGRDYRIDADRTYLAGQGGGAAVALRLATALPELFGGVILIDGDGALPGLDQLRLRLGERLSVALVCGEKDQSRPRLEKYRLPLLTDLGVRTKLWRAASKDGELPPAASLQEALRWLEEDLERRRSDTNEQGATTAEALAEGALKIAKRDLGEPDRLFKAAARLEWLATRFDASQSGRTARDLLDQLRDDPRKNRQWTSQKETEARRVQTAQARAHEKAGQPREARLAWLDVARLADTPERRREAEGEAKRLAELLARTPFLGLTLAGDTTTIRAVTPGGPAQRAGLRAGDRIERVGKAAVDSPAEARKELAGFRPDDVVVLTVRRGERSVPVTVTVGSVPAD